MLVLAMTARLVLHVQPRAKRTQVAGRHGEAIRIRLAALPVEGAANAELVRLIAELLSVPKSAVRIATGRGSRRKVVEIDGLSTDAAEERLLKHGR